MTPAESSGAPGRGSGGGAITARDRLLDAAEARIATVGFAKTTLDDVARAAGLSRATLYRHFAGRGPLVEALIDRELARLDARLARSLSGADDLPAAMTEAVVVGAQAIHANPALGAVLAHEPEIVAAHLAFDASEVVLARGAGLVAPHLERLVAPAVAARAAVWLVRLVVSYTISPSPFVDLLDRASVRRLVDTYLAPGLGSLADRALVT